MFMTNSYTAKMIWLTLCVYIVVSEYLVSGMQCSNQHNNFPVLRFCTDDKATAESSVVLDGHFANTLNGGHNCTCTARALFNKTSELAFEDLPFSSSFQNNVSCGSKVVFKQQNYAERSKICGDDGKLPINDTTRNITVTITLMKVSYPTNTNYSFCIIFEEGNIMDVTCEMANEGDVTTNDHHGTKHVSVMYTEVSTMRLIESSELLTKTSDGIKNVLTTTQQTITEMENSITYKTETTRINESDISHTMYIAIGFGTGGLLIAVLGGVLLFQRFRQKKRQPEENYECTDDDDEDGLQYNTLYVSSDNDSLPQNQEASGTTYHVEGNYTEIDLIEMQKRNENKETTKESCNKNIDTEGNYSEINLDEHVQSTAWSNNDGISNYSEPSKNDSTVFEVESPSKDTSKGSSSVMHILAPGDGGCEYAVVKNKNGNSSGDAVYAVVDKN